MIVFGTRTLPTSWSKEANSASRRSRGREPDLVRDLERELDHVAAMDAGVGVVRLDHVSEQERRPPIGVPKLELVIDPDPTLAGEH